MLTRLCAALAATVIGAVTFTGSASAGTPSGTCIDSATALSNAVAAEQVTATAVTAAEARRGAARSFIARFTANREVREAAGDEVAAQLAVTEAQAVTIQECGDPVVPGGFPVLPPLISVTAPIGVGVGIGTAYNPCP